MKESPNPPLPSKTSPSVKASPPASVKAPANTSASVKASLPPDVQKQEAKKAYYLDLAAKSIADEEKKREAAYEEKMRKTKKFLESLKTNGNQ